MTQLNMHMTEQFRENLERFMRLRGFRNKSQAIRVAINEGLEAAVRGRRHTHFTTWLGLGSEGPLNPSPRFAGDDDLWE